MTTKEKSAEELKLPIKRLEIQINNFNVAIQHHVDLLKRHKANIDKYEAQKDWDRRYREHVNVSRILAQLKTLLFQMDALRCHVLDRDIGQFDKLTGNARKSVMSAVEEYMELQLNVPPSPPLPEAESSTANENETEDGPLDQRQLQLDEEQEKLERQQACAHTWGSLQGEIHQLHELFAYFKTVIDAQKELVEKAEEQTEEASLNVIEGEKNLRKAARYKVAMYPLAGALIGTCIGGPVGLVAGMKVGGLAAIGCGILGATGASLLKKKQLESQQRSIPPETTNFVSLESSTPSSPNDNSKKDL